MASRQFGTRRADAHDSGGRAPGSDRCCSCGFRGELKNVGGALYAFCGDSSNRDAGDVAAANGGRLRRREWATVSTGISPGHTPGDALWPDPHDSQPVPQNAWRAGAILPGEPHVSEVAVNHRSWPPRGAAIPAALLYFFRLFAEVFISFAKVSESRSCFDSQPLPLSFGFSLT